MTAKGKITVEEISVIEVDAAPDTDGVAAPIGSLAIDTNGNGLWQKTGSGNTDWLYLTQLSNLFDVELTSLQTDDILKYDGTNWVNTSLLSNYSTDQITGADGQLSEPMIFITDSTRSNKLLSSESNVFIFTHTSLGSNDWLRSTQDVLNSDSGVIMPYDGTVVRITGHCPSGLANKNISVYFDGTENIGVMDLGNGTGEDESYNTAVDLDFSAGQKLRVQARDGNDAGSLQDVTISLWVKWRTS